MLQIMTNIEINYWLLEILEFIKNFKQVFQLLHFFSSWGLSKSLYSITNLYSLNCKHGGGSLLGENKSVRLLEKAKDYVILHHKEMADYVESSGICQA